MTTSCKFDLRSQNCNNVKSLHNVVQTLTILKDRHPFHCLFSRTTWVSWHRES